ncbi:Protein of unknown function [Paracoccus halophilus]|uniref:DUF2852 domain-containing protein n=1 Tax=Paracoccus halophilus TaxID=376733 RepID=A0A099F3E2_9RHOB|nr:DUF2852 domain-containing protein [Paracoccus halophilus]KGJ04751.1 hypothetical protein IT41_08795 [Paracoccus halophilus]SFA51017.1 Protein of unknown function [Paracoccus halophilus]
MNTEIAPRPSAIDRIGQILASIRDWLDERGKGAWIVVMILGFIVVWPLGLAILGYMIWSNRMFSCRHGHERRSRHSAPSTGNSAFDAYREETLKRLEDEHREFLGFLQKLREAKDKAEFDQFMESRTPPAKEAQA